MEKFNFNNTSENNVESLEKKFQYYLKDFPLTEEELKSPILDVGAGRGEFIQYIRERYQNIDAVGVEKQSIKVDQTKEGVIVADGFDLPFEDETFNTVVAHNYLPMFVDVPEKMQASIMELLRVLKKDGRMMGDIATVESSVEFNTQLKKHLGQEYTQRDEDLHLKKIAGIENFKSFLQNLQKEEMFEIEIVKRGNNEVLIIKKISQ